MAGLANEVGCRVAVDTAATGVDSVVGVALDTAEGEALDAAVRRRMRLPVQEDGSEVELPTAPTVGIATGAMAHLKTDPRTAAEVGTTEAATAFPAATASLLGPAKVEVGTWTGTDRHAMVRHVTDPLVMGHHETDQPATETGTVTGIATVDTAVAAGETTTTARGSDTTTAPAMTTRGRGDIERSLTRKTQISIDQVCLVGVCSCLMSCVCSRTPKAVRPVSCGPWVRSWTTNTSAAAQGS